MATESSSNCQELKTTSQSYLPTEIIVEILLRLPVKSLLRFRCVSKSWCTLISQPQFAKTHLRLASTQSDYTHHRLILRGLHSRDDFQSCSLHSLLNEQSDTAVDLHFPVKVSNGPIRIVGFCDGLVCLKTDRELCIWNPSTRKSKRLPKMSFLGFMSYGYYGFGYDVSNDDYKVVGISVAHRPSDFEVEVNVYTLRTASWRSIGGFPLCCPDDLGKYLNGALHWTVRSASFIVSLDLAKETFGEILEPDYGDGHLNRSLLDVLNGCLCILYSYRDYSDLWVMKEYGARESWTKLVVIPFVKHPSCCLYSTTIPLFILKNGEVLLYTEWDHSCMTVHTEWSARRCMHLVLCNPKDGTYVNQAIHNCSTHFTTCHTNDNQEIHFFLPSTAFAYIESLVLLDIDADSGVRGNTNTKGNRVNSIDGRRNTRIYDLQIAIRRQIMQFWRATPFHSWGKKSEPSTSQSK